MTDELRTLFYHEEGDLATRVHRRRLREWRSMVLGEPLADHRRPLLAELYYSPGESRRIAGEVEAEVNRILALPDFRELAGLLSTVPPLKRVEIPRPLAIHPGEITVYGAPVLAFRDGAKLIFLEIQRGRAEQIAAAAPMIHRYYALEHLKITPERVLSWHLDATDGNRAESPLDLTGAIDRIQRGTMEMLACHLPDGRAAELDFEAKLQHCGQCRFRKYCLS
ncbi:MAG: hypothetical protein AB7F32_06760 [Victivallaceae bacterium]